MPLTGAKFRAQGDAEKHWQEHHDGTRSGPDEDGQDGGDRINKAPSERRAEDLRHRFERLHTRPDSVASYATVPRYPGPTPPVPTGSSQPYSYPSPGQEYGVGQGSRSSNYITSGGAHSASASRGPMPLQPSGSSQPYPYPCPTPQHSQGQASRESPNYMMSSGTYPPTMSRGPETQVSVSLPTVVQQKLDDGYLLIDDVATGVRTVTKTSPKHHITDPILMGLGVNATKLIRESGPHDTQRFSSFKLQKPEFFSLGRVFHILWARATGEADDLSDDITLGALGTQLDSTIPAQGSSPQVRCFVVVRVGNSYCTALPIVTYGPRGVSNSGVKKHEHAIAYSGNTAPKSLKGESPDRHERGMLPIPIRVEPEMPGTDLSPNSRINFGSIYTIQHSVKAKAFGMVHPSYLKGFIGYFKTVHPQLSQRTTSEQTPRPRSNNPNGPVVSPDGTGRSNGISARSQWVRDSATRLKQQGYSNQQVFDWLVSRIRAEGRSQKDADAEVRALLAGRASGNARSARGSRDECEDDDESGEDESNSGSDDDD